jgi:hypothetical protein
MGFSALVLRPGADFSFKRKETSFRPSSGQPVVKRIPSHIAVSLLLCACATVAHGQVFGLDAHTVTVQVLPITTLEIVGGGVALDMNNATIVAGQETMTIADAGSSLRWATNSSNRKITVATNLTAPLFVLRLMAVNPEGGTAAPEVTLSTTPTDLLMSVGRSSGTTVLRYTGVANASQGTGTDNHVITFTVQAQ